MAAAVASSNGMNNVPAAVVAQLLTKHKFIPLGRGDADTNAQDFLWQEKDPQFRQLPVECTGFVVKNGIVYVNGEILSMLSEDLKLKIERHQPIKFDCSMETFNTVMTFVHSTRGKPTNDFLLRLLPMLHECKLSFLADMCAYCIIPSRNHNADVLTAAFAAENEMLLDFVLKGVSSRRSLRHLFDRCGAFRDVRKTAFGGEALGRMMELMAILPEKNPAPGDPVDERVAAFRAACVGANRFRQQLPKYTPDFTVPSEFLDFPLTVGEDTVYASRPVLAHSSRFFHQLLYGDFQEQGATSIVVENASVDELICLLTLVFPTRHGMLWRLTADEGPDPTNRRQCLLRLIYEPQETFGEDPLMFVNVFRLAEYYQISGLVDYLTDVVVHCLPWRQRLQLADLFKSREIMASLLTDDSLKELKQEMAASANALDELSAPTKDLIIEFFLHAINL